ALRRFDAGLRICAGAAPGSCHRPHPGHSGTIAGCRGDAGLPEKRVRQTSGQNLRRARRAVLHRVWRQRAALSLFDPPNQIIFTWQDPDWNAPTTVNVKFTPVPEGTLVELEHTGWETAGVPDDDA